MAAIGLGVLVYLPTLGNVFASDDFVLVERALLPGLFATWGEAEGGFLRPLIAWLFELDAALWGLDPLGYRLTNLVLHGITAWLVGVLAADLTRRVVADPSSDSARTVGLVAAGLFLVHPSHGEAVIWIAGRTDLVSTLFQVAGLIAVVRFVDRGRGGAFVGALAAFALALAAKESALPWPGMAIAIGGLVAIGPDSRASTSRLGRLAWLVGGSAGLLVVYFVVRQALLGVWLGGYGTERHLTVEALAIASRSARFVVRSILPGSPTTAALAIPTLGLLLVAALTIGVVRRRQMVAPLVALGLAYGASLLTALTALDVDLASPRGERFLYLPTVFVCLAVAWVLVDLLPGRRRRSAAGGVVVLAATIALMAGHPAWRQASDTCRELVDAGVETLASDGAADRVIWLTHLPSEQRGRFVLHNGFGASQRLFAQDPPRAAVPLVVIATVAPGSGATSTIERRADQAIVTLDLEPGAWLAEARLPPDWNLDERAAGRIVLTGMVPPNVTLSSLDADAWPSPQTSPGR